MPAQLSVEIGDHVHIRPNSQTNFFIILRRGDSEGKLKEERMRKLVPPLRVIVEHDSGCE